MLDDHTHRIVELAREQTRGREIIEVVEGKRLSAQLLDASENVGSAAPLGVIRGLLVRVLAVGKFERLVERERNRLGKRLVPKEPRGDGCLVCSGRRKGGRSEALARLDRRRAVCPKLSEHRVVVLELANGCDGRVILGSGPQHRGPTDVDHLDDLVLPGARPARDASERIQVHTDEIERLDPVLP